MFKNFLSAGILLLCLFLATTAFAEASKMGYVNMRKLFYEYEKTKKFNQKLEKEDEEAKKEIEKRAEEIKKLRNKIDLLSENAREKREPELRKAMEELDLYRKEKVGGFMKDKDEMFQEIRNDIVDVAGEYAKKNNYDMVFDEAVFVYSSDSHDITDEVLKELNK